MTSQLAHVIAQERVADLQRTADQARLVPVDCFLGSGAAAVGAPSSSRLFCETLHRRGA